MGGGFNHTLLWNDAQIESILGVGTHISAVVGTALDEGAVGVLGLFVKSLIEHGVHHVLHVVDDEIVNVILIFFLNNVMLEHEIDVTELLLHILINRNDGFIIIRNRVGFNLGSIGTRGGDILKQLANFGLGVVHVNVTHDDQRLVVGAIPFVIVVAQHLIGEIIDHVHRADYVTLGVF